MKKWIKRIGAVICIIVLIILVRYCIMSRLYARMTFIGHASVKIKTTTGKVIYIDPYFPTKFSYREPADFILVTHGHSDHNNMSLCTQ
ncbi:MAG: MBL fold metallo-hydrolase, partial [bacterium]|nr:MBL fold metallo-hydrolase [bacterium]